MLIVNGKMMLRQGGQIIGPGEKIDLPDKVAKSLIKVGLAEKAKPGETATVQPKENAAMPKPSKRRRKKSETEAGD